MTTTSNENARTRRPIFSAETLLRPETTLIAVILLIAVGTALRNPNFLNPGNLTDIIRAAVIYFVMACGAALLMIGGGLDFSVGAVFTLGGISAGWLMQTGLPWPLAILGGILGGLIAGWLNSKLIARLHVPPIIATLGTFFIFSGLCVQVTGGQDIVPLPAGFQYVGQGAVFGVPFVVIYAVVIGVIFWFLLEQTPFGIEVRTIGGNRKAALANGLKVARLETVLYVLGGGTAALAGIIYAARVGSAQVSAGGSGTTLSVVTADEGCGGGASTRHRRGAPGPRSRRMPGRCYQHGAGRHPAARPVSPRPVEDGSRSGQGSRRPKDPGRLGTHPDRPAVGWRATDRRHCPRGADGSADHPAR